MYFISMHQDHTWKGDLVWRSTLDSRRVFDYEVGRGEDDELMHMIEGALNCLQMPTKSVQLHTILSQH
jgi:hypothetical protein